MTLWWLLGAFVLHRTGKLPRPLMRQWIHGLLWPLFVLASRREHDLRPLRGEAGSVRHLTRCANTVILTATAIAAIMSDPAYARITQQQAAIATAREFLMREAARDNTNDVDVEIAALDPRLQLRQCPVALEAAFPPGARLAHRTTVVVSCPDASNWRIHLRATVSRQLPAVVWRRDLPRGHLVADKDITTEIRSERNLPRDMVTAPEQAVGAVLRQPVRADTAVRTHLLHQQPLVAKGDQVALTFADSSITISAAAIALGNARAGERVRVKSISSDRELDAVVVERGVVEAL